MTFIWWQRGSTAYEAQFGRIYIRHCHLVGGNWKSPLWCVLDRTTFHWDDSK